MKGFLSSEWFMTKTNTAMQRPWQTEVDATFIGIIIEQKTAIIKKMSNIKILK